MDFRVCNLSKIIALIVIVLTVANKVTPGWPCWLDFSLAPDALTPLGLPPGNNDHVREMQSKRRAKNDATPRYGKPAAELAWSRSTAMAPPQRTIETANCLSEVIRNGHPEGSKVYRQARLAG